MIIDVVTIRGYMAKERLRAEDLATKSGLAISTIWNVLSGKNVQRGTVVLLSLATGIPESKLVVKKKQRTAAKRYQRAS